MVAHPTGGISQCCVLPDPLTPCIADVSLGSWHLMKGTHLWGLPEPTASSAWVPLHGEWLAVLSLQSSLFMLVLLVKVTPAGP